MNEFDLIKRYLEKSGAYKLKGVEYYTEGNQGIIAPATVLLGVVRGVPSPYAFFFGNFEVTIGLGGVIALANTNRVACTFTTVLPGFNEASRNDFSLTVGAGLNAVENAVSYYGHKRFYGVGGNRMDISLFDAGAATFVLDWSFNGYMFRLR